MPLRKVIWNKKIVTIPLLRVSNDYVKTRKPPSVTTSQSNKIEEHNKNKISETKMPKQEINHMEEVIIGMEQGTTFPTKIGTLMCNALIDTGATKSCISEKYYQQLPSTKIQCLKNISVKSATWVVI